jgi:methylase of polypeptide subunit release factors
MNTAVLPIGRPAADDDRADAALLALLQILQVRGYRFVTTTPASHARVLARAPARSALDLRDVFGWSLPFDPDLLDAEIRELLAVADALEPLPDGRVRSRYRVSELGGDLFLHSAYPTVSEDAVFFGPDSYRFAGLVREELRRDPPPPGNRLADIGAGAGVGAIAAAKVCPTLCVTMTDINREALRLAAINAAAARVRAECVQGAHLDGVSGSLDIVLANPPYIIDGAGRDYRDGGDMHGGGVGYEMAVAALDRLSPLGRLILYTGSAIVAGEDPLRQALARLAAETGFSLRYRELDPDVFGEELENPEYRDVERIALVGAVFSRLASASRPDC